MTLTIEEFRSRVSDVINEGSNYDTRIANRASYALRWLERNYSFAYMSTRRNFLLNEGFKTGSISFKSGEIKKIEYLSYSDTDTGESFRVLPGTIDQTQLGTSQLASLFQFHQEADPVRFYMSPALLPDTTDLLLEFTSVSGKNYIGAIFYVRYTELPVDDSDNNGEHPMLDFAPDLLEAQTLLFLAPTLRDADLYNLAKDQRDEALRTALIASEELQDHGPQEMDFCGSSHAI